MLKMTRIELVLISDINVHLFIGMRGGISYICKRHSKVNDCDSEEKKSLWICKDSSNAL